MTEKICNVMFLCRGNSARSIMAEAVLNRSGGSRFRAFSAGSHPAGEVHPYTLNLLKSQNYSTSELRSKDWTEFAQDDAPVMDFVFTVCDRTGQEVCPVWPGQPMSAHWGIPDPAAAQGAESERRAAFQHAMRLITDRIGIFVALPLEALDRQTLQERLEEIG